MCTKNIVFLPKSTRMVLKFKKTDTDQTTAIHLQLYTESNKVG